MCFGVVWGVSTDPILRLAGSKIVIFSAKLIHELIIYQLPTGYNDINCSFPTQADGGGFGRHSSQVNPQWKRIQTEIL